VLCYPVNEPSSARACFLGIDAIFTDRLDLIPPDFALSCRPGSAGSPNRSASPPERDTRLFADRRGEFDRFPRSSEVAPHFGEIGSGTRSRVLQSVWASTARSRSSSASKPASRESASICSLGHALLQRAVRGIVFAPVQRRTRKIWLPLAVSPPSSLFGGWVKSLSKPSATAAVQQRFDKVQQPASTLGLDGRDQPGELGCLPLDQRTRVKTPPSRH